MTINDLMIVGTLVLLEALLSADNALVLALIARRLPDPNQRSRALTIGVGLSFGLRVVGLLVASYIIKFWFLRAAGALYLIYLCVAHFRHASKHKSDPLHDHAAPGSQATFRSVVTALALTDAAFAVDSILVAVALTEKLWVIYIGVALGNYCLAICFRDFLKLLERYPALDHAAYGLVGWAGLHLLLEAIESFGETVMHQHWPVLLPDWAFWTGMAVIVVIGTVYARRHPNQELARKSPTVLKETV